MGFISIPRFESVDLIKDFEILPQHSSSRMVAIFDNHANFLCPGMARKVSTDQFSVLRPIIKSVCRIVNTEEGFPSFNKVRQCLFLFFLEWQIASSGKNEQVCVSQRFGRDTLAVMRSSNLPTFFFRSALGQPQHLVNRYVQNQLNVSTLKYSFITSFFHGLMPTEGQHDYSWSVTSWIPDHSLQISV